MKPRGILRNVFTVGSFTALSRVLGLVREMLQSRLVGAGVAQSAFTLAFALPNMARKLFGEGALTAAFVPVFKKELQTGSMESAARLARSVMTSVIMMLCALTAIAFLSLDVFASVRSSVSAMANERFELTASLLKILFPYMIFICAAAFGMGVMNSLGRFKASAFMPCLLNIFWIGILLWMWFFPVSGMAVRVKMLATAILVAGAVQMAFMFCMMAKRGVRPIPLFSGWKDERFRLVWRNVAIGAVGAGAIQINCLLDQVLAQLAAPWAAGAIGYAERLMDLPLGVVAVTFGTVLLPTFAGAFAREDYDGARDMFGSSLVSLLFVMVPAATGLFILSSEVTSVIYEGGAFDSLATQRVSRAVAMYALGLVFFGVQKLIIPWFQAQNDMKTPLKVSLYSVVLNAVLNILAVVTLPEEWRHVGLAASTVFCSGAGCLMLVVFAKRKNGVLGFDRAASSLVKICFSSMMMAAAVYAVKICILRTGTLRMSDSVKTFPALALLVAVGLLVYFACSVLVFRIRPHLPRR